MTCDHCEYYEPYYHKAGYYCQHYKVSFTPDTTKSPCVGFKAKPGYELDFVLGL